jgi:hypothetical protein
MKQNYVTFFLLLGLTTFINARNFRGNWNVVSLESNGNIINIPSTITTVPNINFDSFLSSPPTGPSDQYCGYYINSNGICNPSTSYFETSSNSCDATEETDF